MDQESVSVEGPGGLKASATGQQTLHLLLAVLGGLWTWYLVIYVQDAKSAEREKERIVAVAEQTKALKELVKASERQTKTQKAMIFVLTMSQKEREKLHLVRPEILDEMQGYPRER